MRPRKSNHSGFGINSVQKSRNVGKTAENFWILLNQLIIDIRQQHIGIGPADNRKNRFHPLVGKSLMQIFQPFFHRSRSKQIAVFICRIPAKSNL